MATSLGSMDGIFSRSELAEAGLTDWGLRQTLATGRLRSLTRGWFASTTADPRATSAILTGCRIGCLSAAEIHGLWVPPSAHRHWIAPRRREIGPLPSDVVVHRTGDPLPRVFQSVDDCLWQIIRAHDAETALMVMESAARLEAVPRSTLLNMIELAPTRSRGTLGFFCDRSESGTETRVRLFYQRRHVRVRAQVAVPEVGRVDLLIGESHIVECDSRAHHERHDRYLIDRHRDLGADMGDYRHTRLAWEQVFTRWPETQQALSTTLRRRTHRHVPRNASGIWMPQLHTPEWLAS